MVAIYRCCVRYGKDREWAKARVREVCPQGHRDYMLDVWFADIENIRARHKRTSEPEVELALAVPRLRIAA